MLVMGDKVRLSPEELDLMMNEAGCRIAPETVDDFNAWVDEIKYPDPTPDEKLLNALIEKMKIVDGTQEKGVLAVLSTVHLTRDLVGM